MSMFIQLFFIIYPRSARSILLQLPQPLPSCKWITRVMPSDSNWVMSAISKPRWRDRTSTMVVWVLARPSPGLRTCLAQTLRHDNQGPIYVRAAEQNFINHSQIHADGLCLGIISDIYLTQIRMYTI